MQRKIASVLFLIGALACMLAFFTGCKGKAPETEKSGTPAPGKVVAEVNSVKITAQELDRAVARAMGQHSGKGVKADNPAMRESVLEGLITEAMILDAARGEKFENTDAEADAKIAFIRNQLGEDGYKAKLAADGYDEAGYRKHIIDTMLKQRFISERLMPVNAVTVDEAKRRYKESPTPYIHPAEIQVRFIQTATFEAADAIIKESRKPGASFDEIADRLEKENKAVVSAYGWTRASMFPGEIGAGLEKIKKGSIGGPFEGKGQFYIFRVKDRKPERPKSFEEVRDEIMEEIYRAKRDGVMAHWLANARANAKIIKH